MAVVSQARVIHWQTAFPWRGRAGGGGRGPSCHSPEHFIHMRVALCRAGGSPCQRTSHCEDPTDAEQQLLTIVRRRVMTTWQFCAILYVPSWQQGDAPWTNRHDFCNG